MEQKTLARWLKVVPVGVGLCGLAVCGAILPLYSMSILKTGKAKAVKISNLARLCEALDSQPGDLPEYRRAGEKEP